MSGGRTGSGGGGKSVVGGGWEGLARAIWDDRMMGVEKGTGWGIEGAKR